MKTIARKSMLYKTGVEYGDYTMNHVAGCAHGCKYPCYAFLMAKRFGKVSSYKEWLEPKLVSNTLEILDKEIPHLKENIQSVQLCFTTDPFMCGFNEIKNMSLSAIKKLNDAQIKCTILTKGLLPFELSQFSKENEYGITLISLDEKYRKKVEPGAATYVARLNALRKLHDAGCKTWVSIEPYPTPNLIAQDIYEILKSILFTDRIIFGRTNYNKEISAYTNHKDFYNEQAKKVIGFCIEHKIAYHIKTGTITQDVK
jgi:DNA repair photolyase